MSVRTEALRIAAENSGVVGLKLANGEMIIATLVDKSTSASTMMLPWKLVHPFLLLLGPGSVNMMPWLASSQDDSEVEADISSHVMVPFKPSENLTDGYLEATGQKRIAVPSKPRILLN